MKKRILKKPLPKELDHEYGWYGTTLKKCFYAKDLKKMNHWFTGQTGAICEKTGQFVYYSWDVDRYLNLMLKGEPTYFD